VCLWWHNKIAPKAATIQEENSERPRKKIEGKVKDEVTNNKSEASPHGEAAKRDKNPSNLQISHKTRKMSFRLVGVHTYSPKWRSC